MGESGNKGQKKEEVDHVQPGVSRDHDPDADKKPTPENLAGKGEKIVSGRESPDWLIKSREKPEDSN